MTVHGHASIDARDPRALGVCDRCGALYNHHQLRWQYDWRGPKLQNLRILVCHSCQDKPQENGQRTIILPADPVPIMNARPEQYVADSQPLSGIGGDPSPARWQYGSIFGSMTEGGGPQAAFDANPVKPSFMSAVISRSGSSFTNYVGVSWTGRAVTVTPSSIGTPVLSHTVVGYVLNAPTDSTFGSTGYVVQGSAFGSTDTPSWTTIASGTFAGTVAEQSSSVITSAGRYEFHRVAFYGNGGGAIAVAAVALTVADGSSI